jgi:hypothetical protein
VLPQNRARSFHNGARAFRARRTFRYKKRQPAEKAVEVCRPSAHDFLAELNKPFVPDVERIEKIRAFRNIFEQSVSLGKAPIVFRKNGGIGGPNLAESRVGEGTPSRRAARKQRKMLRRKNSSAEFADERGAGAFFDAVQFRGAPSADYADFRRLVAAVGKKVEPNFGAFATAAHKLRVLGTPKGALARKQPHSLEKVGLSLRVASVDDVFLRPRNDFAGGEIAEVPPSKSLNLHALAAS